MTARFNPDQSRRRGRSRTNPRDQTMTESGTQPSFEEHKQEVQPSQEGRDLQNLIKEKIERLYEKYQDLVSLVRTDEVSGKFFDEYVRAELENVVGLLEELKIEGVGIITTGLTEMEITTPTEVIASTLIFQKNEGKIEEVFRLCLGVFILNREDLVGNERVKKFLEEASFDELMWYSKILNKEGVILISITTIDDKTRNLNLEIAIPQVHERWQVELLNLCLARIKSIEDIEKYWDTISNGFKKKLKDLRQSLKKRLIEEGKREEEAEKEVDGIIRNLEKLSEVDFEELKKLPPDQLNQYLEGMKQIGELLGEIQKEKEKGKDFIKHPNWEKIKEFIGILGGMSIAGGLLWFTFFAFFLPVYFVEKIKKEIKI